MHCFDSLRGSSLVALLVVAGSASLVTSCVSRGRYDAKAAELAQATAKLATARRTDQARQREASALQKRLAALQKSLTASTSRSAALLAKLDRLNQRADELEGAARSREQVVTELDAQLKAQQALVSDFKELALALGAETPDDLKRALAEIQQRVGQTEAALRAANSELARERRIVKKLQALIDAGALRVRRRAGRLVIELPGDIHFSPGSVKLTELGRSALERLSAVLGAERDRLFVVEGHTDNQPIKVSGFRSNWHLGSMRAEVSREALVASGLDGKRVAIASWADLLPACLGVNNAECRARNRRVEVLLLPKFR